MNDKKDSYAALRLLIYKAVVTSMPISVEYLLQEVNAKLSIMCKMEKKGTILEILLTFMPNSAKQWLHARRDLNKNDMSRTEKRISSKMPQRCKKELSN